MAPTRAARFDPTVYLSLPPVPLEAMVKLAESLIAHLPEEPSPTLNMAGKQLASAMIVANEELLARVRGDGSAARGAALETLGEDMHRALLVYASVVLGTLSAAQPTSTRAVEAMLRPLLALRLGRKLSGPHVDELEDEDEDDLAGFSGTALELGRPVAGMGAGLLAAAPD